MRPNGTATHLSVFIGEDDLWHHKPLYHEIVRRAREAGLAGASVFKGIEGYGANSAIHTTRIVSMSDDLPTLIVIVDGTERIREFLPELEDLGIEGMVMLDQVEVVHYAGREDA